jgi:tetratricopeptide (TPR) repeat protein
MSYLLDFVKSLSETELQQFRQLDLIGKEELVRNEYANQFSDKTFDESALQAKLYLSKSHFDKINSVLLNKAVAHFAGSNLGNKLDFLFSKQLEGLVLHELKVLEKQLKKQHDQNALKDFYDQASICIIRFNFNYFPVKEIEYYVTNYIQLLGADEEAKKYKALAKRETVLIQYYSSRKNGDKNIEKSSAKLLQWETEIKDKNLFEAEYAIYLGIGAYYEIFDNEKCLYYLKQADTAAKKVYDKLSESEKIIMLSMLGQHYIVMNRFEEGIAKYEEAYSKFPHIIGTRLYHPYQLVFALLIVKDFKKAKEAMKAHMEPFLKNENARNFHFDILRLYAIYHLLNHETEKAGNYLQQLQQFGKEDFTVLGDVLFRLVHNVYCIQTGDYALANDVFKKNIKYLDSKIEIAGFSAYKEMFLDLGKVLRFKIKNNSQQASAVIEKLNPGEGRGRLYAELIKLPLQK